MLSIWIMEHVFVKLSGTWAERQLVSVDSDEQIIWHFTNFYQQEPSCSHLRKYNNELCVYVCACVRACVRARARVCDYFQEKLNWCRNDQNCQQEACPKLSSWMYV